jgi:hypothetical protein
MPALRLLPLALLLALAGLALAGCDSSGDSRDIAETDATGTVLDDDPDDWQPRCSEAPTTFCANPAYPNPVPSSGTVTLEFSTPVEQRVEVRIGDGRLTSRVFEAGLHRLAVEVSPFALGFVGVTLDPAEQGDEIEGDLRIVED